MIKSPLIIGNRGGMGQRYSAILRYLGVHFSGIDEGDHLPPKGMFDGVIIASPTFMHVQHIWKVWDYGVPILCEKPLSTDLREVLDICNEAERDGVKLRCVNQYAELATTNGQGESHYDYFRTGNDGLEWDCISIIALAKGKVTLANKSPLWTCEINGQPLSLADMDKAYVLMIKAWLEGEQSDLNYIRKAHLKVSEYINRYD